MQGTGPEMMPLKILEIILYLVAKISENLSVMNTENENIVEYGNEKLPLAKAQGYALRTWPHLTFAELGKAKMIEEKTALLSGDVEIWYYWEFACGAHVWHAPDMPDDLYGEW